MTDKHQALRDALLSEAVSRVLGIGAISDIRALLADHDRMRAALEACERLLKRTPKITQDIYVGRDRVAWGVQAEAALNQIREAMQECER